MANPADGLFEPARVTARPERAPRVAPTHPVPIDPAARLVAELAHKLAGYFGSEDAALEFMRAFPGCVIEIPPADEVERQAGGSWHRR